MSLYTNAPSLISCVCLPFVWSSYSAFVSFPCSINPHAPCLWSQRFVGTTSIAVNCACLRITGSVGFPCFVKRGLNYLWLSSKGLFRCYSSLAKFLFCPGKPTLQYSERIFWFSFRPPVLSLWPFPHYFLLCYCCFKLGLSSVSERITLLVTLLRQKCKWWIQRVMRECMQEKTTL